jgi:hypothetical protein
MMSPYEPDPRKTLTLSLAHKAAKVLRVTYGIIAGIVVEAGRQITVHGEYTGSSPYEKMERALTALPSFGYN